MLYLVATPIGNLKDLTFRAIEILNACDLILCEDTRHSLGLLKHYDISKPLRSYHQFNEAASLDKILTELKQGKVLALISDAGTPGVSDPGERLVKACIEAEIPVIPIPGPCAAIAALSCSGLPTHLFQFVGFLPRQKGELRSLLREHLEYKGTTICYEAPHRLHTFLQTLGEMAPHRMLVIARELTKKFEEWKRGTAAELLTHWAEPHSIKGEIVLLIAPSTEKGPSNWEDWSPQEHVDWVQKTFSISLKDAIKIVAEIRLVPKRILYQAIHIKEDKI